MVFDDGLDFGEVSRHMPWTQSKDVNGSRPMTEHRRGPGIDMTEKSIFSANLPQPTQAAALHSPQTTHHSKDARSQADPP
jgi:hypothetical protein